MSIESKYCGVYKITNICNNKSYIGKTIMRFSKRISWHRCQLKKGLHPNTYLQKSWDKYGEENFSFTILYKIEISNINKENKKDIDSLIKEREIYFIKFYKSIIPMGYNVTPGGDGNIGDYVSKESRKIIGEFNRKRMIGSKLSEETKNKMSESHKGLIRSEEHKRNLSIALKGRVISEEWREKCRVANQGSKQKTSKYTEEIIEKVRIDIMNGLSMRIISEKYNIKISYLYTIKNNNRWKHVSPDGWESFCAK